MDSRPLRQPRGLPPLRLRPLNLPRADRAALVYVLELAAVAGVYFGAAKLGLGLAHENSSISAIWPPTGIALAALLLRGYRMLPAVALGAFLANSWTGVPLVTVAGITLGNSLEALVGCYLLRRVGFRIQLDRARDVLALVGLAATASTMVSATIGVGSLVLGDALDWDGVASAWRLWWLGDMGGAIIVAPLLLALAQPLSRSRLTPARLAEAAGLGAVLLVAVLWVLPNDAPLAFLLFPPVLWAAFRFHQRGAALASAIVGVAAVLFTVHGYRDFVSGSPDDELLLSQGFAGVTAVTALMLAAMTSERARAKEALQEAHDELEQKVRERTAELSRSKHELEIQGTIAANMAEGVMIVRASDGVIGYANPTFERMFGYEPGELEGQPVHILNAATGKDPEDTAREILTALEHRGSWNGEVENVRRDGSRFWTSLTASAFEHPEHGRVWVSVQSDITERKFAEEALREAGGRLARSNADLREFAHVVSHDLSEPLLTVRGFAELIERRHGDTLDDDVRRYLQLIMGGAERMQNLIAGLLDYSRAGQHELALERTDTAQLVEQVLSDLHAVMEAKDALVEVGPLPHVLADPTQLRQVIQNLVANALKFGGTEPPRIEIRGGSDPSGEWFSVSDNGIGIAPEQRERVFGAFQRLHGREDYAGSGMGLAVCRRIVERHGGRIWVEDGESGRGSRFVFALPDSADLEEDDHVRHEQQAERDRPAVQVALDE